MKSHGGADVVVTGDTGIYQSQTQLLDLFGEVTLVHENGTRFVTQRARLDAAHNTAEGNDPVEGHGPSGDITAQGFRIFDKGDTIIFTGRSDMLLRGAKMTTANPRQPPAVPAAVAATAARVEAQERAAAPRAAKPASEQHADRPSGKAGGEALPPHSRHGRRRRRQKRLAVARSPRFRLCVLAAVTWLAFAPLATTPGHHAAAQLLNPVERTPAAAGAGRFRHRMAAGRKSSTSPAAMPWRPADQRGSGRHADRLLPRGQRQQARLRSTGGNTEIYRVEAEGHVTMTRDGQTDSRRSRRVRFRSSH